MSCQAYKKFEPFFFCIRNKFYNIQTRVICKYLYCTLFTIQEDAGHYSCQASNVFEMFQFFWLRKNYPPLFVLVKTCNLELAINIHVLPSLHYRRMQAVTLARPSMHLKCFKFYVFRKFSRLFL